MHAAHCTPGGVRFQLFSICILYRCVGSVRCTYTILIGASIVRFNLCDCIIVIIIESMCIANASKWERMRVCALVQLKYLVNTISNSPIECVDISACQCSLCMFYDVWDWEEEEKEMDAGWMEQKKWTQRTLRTENKMMGKIEEEFRLVCTPLRW